MSSVEHKDQHSHNYSCGQYSDYCDCSPVGSPHLSRLEAVDLTRFCRQFQILSGAAFGR